ncbi:GPN-loop GTPase 2-like [Prunus persica]|uniref:GPN-loop GTPase 2-like n=1 Tax=Prunus persica TaxID=3760 RepID=UPI0009AB3C93|nr:GPN-loop GTPase 2-like [Prunus persica]
MCCTIVEVELQARRLPTAMACLSSSQLIGRKAAVVNLEPANDALPYECAVNIEDLRKLSDVVVEHTLGPNGEKPGGDSGRCNKQEE